MFKKVSGVSLAAMMLLAGNVMAQNGSSKLTVTLEGTKTAERLFETNSTSHKFFFGDPNTYKFDIKTVGNAAATLTVSSPYSGGVYHSSATEDEKIEGSFPDEVGILPRYSFTATGGFTVADNGRVAEQYLDDKPMNVGTFTAGGEATITCSFDFDKAKVDVLRAGTYTGQITFELTAL